MDRSITISQPSDWWRNAVIYQIYPRSFMDSNGDGIGDLPGILQKLDYIASLEVDAVWLSPFYPSPMKDFGYDVSDFCSVDPIFGTLDDFKRLLNACHQNGLKVLIDQVWNHTSDQHPWFLESAQSRDNLKADWYVWVDPAPDGGVPNNWLSTFGGSAWTWNEARQQYYLHNFLVEQPDLNWYNPAVRAAILEVAEFWLELGVDGFRLDVVNFFTHDRQLRDNPPRPQSHKHPAGAGANDPFFDNVNLYNFCQPETLEFLQPIRELVDRYPNRTTLAEISSAEDTIATSSEYVRGDRRLHMAYNSSLMSDRPLDYSLLQEIITRIETELAGGAICWTGGTHDFPRLKSRWRKYLIDDEFTHEAFDHLFAALLISLRGSCCIYQGDELGLTQAELPFEHLRDPFGIAGYPTIKGRDGSRTPMPWEKEAPYAGFTTGNPWLPLALDHYRHAVDQQDPAPSSLLNQYRRLIAWRKQQPAFRQGQLILQPTQEPIVGFIRQCPAQRLLCLFNFSPMPIHHDLAAYGTCREAGESGFVNRCYETTVELSGYGAFFGNLQPPALFPQPTSQPLGELAS